MHLRQRLVAPLRRPSTAMARIARRRLRVLASRPLAFAAFTALRAGEGPVHLRGRCAPLPGHGAAPIWRTEERDDAADGRLLIEEGHDFLLSIDGGDVYVLSKGGHLVERRDVARRAMRSRCSASSTRSPTGGAGAVRPTVEAGCCLQSGPARSCRCW